MVCAVGVLGGLCAAGVLGGRGRLESLRVWHDRSTEHILALKAMDEKNPLVKHMLIHHKDQQGRGEPPNELQ